MTVRNDAPTGIDEEGLSTWLIAHVPDIACPLSFQQIAGGRSNLTYIVEDAKSQSWVLRRPPVGSLLRSAHDVAREARILTELETTNVPVPRVVDSCTDDRVLGANFYVMQFVEGVVLDSAAAAAELSSTACRRASLRVVDTLARIHEVDCSVGFLESMKRPGGYVGRQLRRWGQQLTALPGPCDRTDELTDLQRALAAKAPPESWTGLVHGDYRPANLILGPDGEVRAVLDWELATVGDVLADLGWLVAMWTHGDLVGWAPDPRSGFATPHDIIERYHQLTGRNVADVDFYHAFALWRLACIGEGVHARYSAGMMGDQRRDLDRLSDNIFEMTVHARRLLARV